MQKKLKFITTCCAVLMLGGLLASCSGNNKEGAEPSTSPAAATATSTSAGTPTSTPGKPLELTVMRFEQPAQAVLNDSVVVKEILKRKNVKLQMQSVPQSNYDDKKKTLIATNTLPDIMLVSQADIQNFADSGAFLDLTPYLPKMPNLAKWIAAGPEINKNKIDGKLYGFPLTINSKFAVKSGQLPMIRMDLLGKLNLKTPTTYDELYQVLKKFKEAYPDVYPFVARGANGLTGTENLINPIAFGFGSGYTTSNGSKIYYDPATKKYRFGPDSPEFKQAITWLHQLYKDKLLDPGYTTANSTIWKEALNSSKAFYFQDNAGLAGGMNQILQKTDPNAKFDMIPTMAAPNGMKRNQIYADGHIDTSFVIKAGVKNAEQVVQFMDWLYSDEGVALTNFGIEGVDYTVNNGNYKFVEAVKAKYKDQPTSKLFSDYGIGYLQLAVVEDDRASLDFDPNFTNPWSDRIAAAELTGENFAFVIDPPFTSDERSKLKQIRSKLDAYLTANMDKFIIKDGGLDEWDGFVKEAKSKGSDEMVKIYNDALARVK
jgi:putative aldouronate transport system substrate-binding protein